MSVSNLYAKNIRGDMEDRWVTNLSEDRKRFYLVSSLLDPHTKMLSFCDNKYFPSSWKDDALGYFSMDLKSFSLQRTQGEVKDSDGQVKHRSDLDELLGMSTTSVDFDVASVEGEGQLQTYMQVQAPTGSQRHGPSDVVEAASVRVSRLDPNG